MKVHEALFHAGEYEKSPHRLTENVKRMSEKIRHFVGESRIENHLDIGCEDGFIFEAFDNSQNQYGVHEILKTLSLNL